MTSSNCTNITGDGKVTYEPATNTLTLINAFIASEGNCIYADCDVETPLTINFCGASSLESSKADAIYLRCVTNILSTNGGSVTISSMSGNGIYQQYRLTVSDCTLNVNGYNCGFYAYNYASNFTVNITNATVNAKGTKAAFCNYRYAYLTDCYIAESHPCEFDGKTEALSGFTRYGKLCTEVQIVPGKEPTWYDIQVMGKYINSNNAADILGNGQLSWDADENVLTMKDLDLTCDGLAIVLDEETTIKLIGDNKITSTSNAITARMKYLAVTGEGTGKLTIKTTSEHAPCIYAVKVPLSFRDCDLEFEGGEGVTGYNNDDYMYDLVISNANAHIKATTAGYGAIADFRNVTLDGCKFLNDAEYNSELKGVAIGGALAGEVTVQKITETNYDITIAGVTVNSSNNADVLGDGTVTYDPEAKKLTLNNATIVGGVYDGIICATSPITLEVKGVNTITSDYVPLMFDAIKVNIMSTDGGTLVLNTGEATSAMVFTYSNDVTFTDVNIKAKAGNYGIYSDYGSTIAEVKNCNMEIESGVNAIKGFHAFRLEDCYFAEPANAIYNVLKSCVTDKDDYTVEYANVTIKAGEVGISDITADEASAPQYNIQGMLTDKAYKGIVIKNGKKFVRK